MFKTTLYFSSVPLGIMFIVGIFSLIIGIVTRNQGVAVAVLPFVVMPFIMIFVYGLFGVLAGGVYNFFSKRFGGLELRIEKEDSEMVIE